LLSHHYRSSWEYTDEEMEASAAHAQRLADAARGPAGGAAGADDISQRAIAEFTAALENDLDTPGALRVLDELARQADAPGAAQTLRELAGVLGLTLGLTDTPAAAAPVQCGEPATPA
jgi:L-cysteine:1D-myo-inositol 2-amino-2-deoxy-alpha-D-glucopyranoside ligase